MGLISAYILGFGTLKERQVEFSRGLNAYCQENGAGKTTLAAFFKAMLYGLPSYKSNSRSFEDRRRYCPFDGGPFGGSLTVEYGGKTYCITRHFDPKSEAKDTLTVTCEGQPTDELGPCPGVTIYGVDRQSLERTAFFTADPGTLGATHDIAGRLQSLVEGSREQGFARADLALAEAARQLQGVRGQTGQIPRQAERIRSLERDVQTKNQLQAALAAHTQRYAALEQALEQEQTDLENARRDRLAREQWAVYAQLDDQAQAFQAQAAALERRWGSPTAEQTQQLRQCHTQMLQARAQLDGAALPPEKQSRLRALRTAYPRGIPSGPVLDQARALTEELSQPPALPPEPKRPWLWLVGLVLALTGLGLCFGKLWLGAALAALGLAVIAGVWLRFGKARSAWKRGCEALLAEHRERQQQLYTLLLPYGLSRYHPELYRDGQLLAELSREEEHFATLAQNARRSHAQARERAREVLEQCGLQAQPEMEGQIAAMLLELETIPKFKADAALYRRRAEDYRRERGLQQEPGAEKSPPEQLARSLELSRRELATLQRQLGDMEYRLEDLAECDLALEEARQQLAALENRYRLVNISRKCLTDAEAALRRKHISPVRSRFDHYCAMLEQALGEKLALDKDFNLYLVEKGREQDQRHLSPGQRCLAALCLRLSLLDNLYPGEKPPVVLDDPFAFLDGEHMEKARCLLRELARHWQILYFTCHESRQIREE